MPVCCPPFPPASVSTIAEWVKNVTVELSLSHVLLGLEQMDSPLTCVPYTGGGVCPAGPLTCRRDGLTPLREFATGRLCSAEADCNNDCKTRPAMSSTEGMVDPAVDVPGMLPVAVTTDVVVTAGVPGLLVVVAIICSLVR